MRHGVDHGLQILFLLQTGGVCLRGAWERAKSISTLPRARDGAAACPSTVLPGARGTGTCGGGVLGLEEAHDALAMQPSRAQQHGLGAGVAPAHHGEAVLAVAAGDALDRVVLDALRHDEQPGSCGGERGLCRARRGAAPAHPQLPWVTGDPRCPPTASPRRLPPCCSGSPPTNGVHAVHRGDAEGLVLGAREAAAERAQPQPLVVAAAGSLHQVVDGLLRRFDGGGGGQSASVHLLGHCGDKGGPGSACGMQEVSRLQLGASSSLAETAQDGSCTPLPSPEMEEL